MESKVLRGKDNADCKYYYLRIQGVLCVNEDYFPTRVAVLARQLSSDWKKKTHLQRFSFIQQR